ncbi:MAG TPA: hypothetical protein VGF87_10910, partial [Acidimicrobiales bacterium]
MILAALCAALALSACGSRLSSQSIASAARRPIVRVAAQSGGTQSGSAAAIGAQTGPAGSGATSSSGPGATTNGTTPSTTAGSSGSHATTAGGST